MSESIFLPGFDTAPAHNRLIVRSGQAGVPEYLGCPIDLERRQVGIQLTRSQNFASQLGTLMVDQPWDSEESVQEASSWSELRNAVTAKVHTYLGGMCMDNLGPLDRTHVFQVSGEGVEQTAAFLEVIPEVLACQEFDDPNAELAEWAKRSMGFIIAWTGIHNLVDPKLVYALAKPKPSNPSDPYPNVRYNSRWFSVEGNRVVLDKVKAQNLRDETHTRHPIVAQKKERAVGALLGCPGERLVPYIYRECVELALHSHLFSQAYETARSNLGYV